MNTHSTVEIKEDFDKPLTFVNYLYTIYMNRTKFRALSKSSKILFNNRLHSAIRTYTLKKQNQAEYNHDFKSILKAVKF
jgi:hypothetical protein